MTFNITHELGTYPTDYDEAEVDSEYIPIEVDNREVLNDLAALVADNYLVRKVNKDEYDRIKHVVKNIIEDYDLFDKLCEDYADQLRELYEEEYNRG